MKVKLILIAVLLLACKAHGAPFLVDTPYPATGPQPDSYSCIFDNGAAISTPSQLNADSSKQLHYDLASITPGVHTASCAAVSAAWGPSAQSGKLSFSAGIPAVPTGLGLSAK